MNAGEVASIYTVKEEPNRPALCELLPLLQRDGIDISTVTELRERFDPTWPAIDEWLDCTAPELNRIVRAMTAILDPGAIVYGGEAPLDLRKRLIDRTLPRRLNRFGNAIPSPELVLSEIEVSPSMLGAALLPIRERLF